MYSGWRQGFVVQICTLAALVAGIWLAARFGLRVGEWLHLDEQSAAAGGFVVVLIAVIVAVAITARILRKVLHFAGFGIADRVLGVVTALFKYLLITSALFAAFDRLNTDYSLVGPQTIQRSKCYRPMIDFSQKVVPFIDRIGERLPESPKQREA